MRRFLLLLCFCLFLPLPLFAFPDTEQIGVSGADPPFDFGFSDTLTGFVLKDDRTMIASYGETLAIVDLAYFALAADQPPPLSEDAGTDGRLTSIAYSADHDRVYAPQDDGDCLIYDMANITVDPTTVVVADGKVLGQIALDNSGRRAYIVGTADHTVNILNLSTLTVDTVIVLSIPSISALNVTAAAHDVLTDEIYFATDKGSVFYIAAGGTTGVEINIDGAHTANLSSIAATPNGSYVYVTNETDNTLVKIDASTHAVINDSIDLSENPGPTGIAITDVTHPQGGEGNAVYAYVAGSLGMSVVNTTGDLVLDMGTDPDVDHEPLPMSVVPHNLAASTVDDGYVYSANATQSVGVVSANPWVTISSVTYSGGGSSMGVGESFTIAFQADETGTATIRSGGDVDGSGTALVDNAGASSWNVATADTDVSVQVNYDDNSSAFIEGDNDIFVFVTSAAGDTGRIATVVNVDTPPPAVTMRSTGFGTGKIYVTFDRIDAADMNHYNVYVDANPATVLTKTDIAAQPAQAASGSTQEAEVDGLSNGYTYYIAMEAADNAGNVSLSRTNTFSDGSVAFAIPQQTGGPCEFSGQSGCTIVSSTFNALSLILYLSTLFCLLLIRILSFVRRCRNWEKVPFVLSLSKDEQCNFNALYVHGSTSSPRTGNCDTILQRGGIVLLFLLFFLFFSQISFAKQPSPQWWEMELKTGFWMPSSDPVNHFFDNCCNLVTRVQGGLLVHGRYGAEGGVGFLIKDGTAVGRVTGVKSRDRFNFILIPMETNFAWRIDYWTWDYLVPYVKAGIDYVYFRENLQGNVTQGLKLGFHGALGAQLNLKLIDEDGIKGLDDDFGINDLFLTLEAQYQFIDNFGGSGLDLSGPVFSIGFLFEF